MKKYLLFLFSLCSISLYAQDLPIQFFALGTPKNKIIYDWGEPKYLSKAQVHYDLRYQNTLEGIDFFLDEDGNLGFYLIDVIVQPSPIIDFNELFQMVFNDYVNKYITLFGDPTQVDQDTATYVWKYQDASVVFYPYQAEVYLRMRLLCAPNELLKDVIKN